MHGPYYKHVSRCTVLIISMCHDARSSECQIYILLITEHNGDVSHESYKSPFTIKRPLYKDTNV